MKTLKPTLLILAAGMGSRYGGLKQLDPLGPNGETIMDYSIYDAINAGFGKVVFVIRKSFEKDFTESIISKYKNHIKTEVVFQELSDLPDGYTLDKNREKPWGTNHAVLVAKDVIKEPFAVINADDFYGRESYEILADKLNKLAGDENHYCMVGYRLENTLSEGGAVSRGVCKVDKDSYLESVVECTHIMRRDDKIEYKDANDQWTELAPKTLVSMNMWGFTPDYFEHSTTYFKEFLDENEGKLKAEFYIPTAIDKLIKFKIADVKVLDTAAQWFGVTYSEDRAGVVQKLANLVKEGVYPSPLW